MLLLGRWNKNMGPSWSSVQVLSSCSIGSYRSSLNFYMHCAAVFMLATENLLLFHSAQCYCVTIVAPNGYYMINATQGQLTLWTQIMQQTNNAIKQVEVTWKNTQYIYGLKSLFQNYKSSIAQQLNTTISTCQRTPMCKRYLLHQMIGPIEMSKTTIKQEDREGKAGRCWKQPSQNANR